MMNFFYSIFLFTFLLNSNPCASTNEETLESITVSIEPSWQMHPEYKNLLQQNKAQIRTVLYRKDLPLLDTRIGHKVANEHEEWLIQNIPQEWLKSADGQNRPGEPNVVLTIQFPLIHLSDSGNNAQPYNYQPRIRRPFQMKRNKQFYLFSILEAELQVRQWSENEKDVMEAGRQLLEPENERESPHGSTEIKEKIREMHSEMHSPSSQSSVAVAAPETTAEMIEEIAKNNEEMIIAELRAQQAPFECLLRKLLLLHQNNLIFQKLLKEAIEQVPVGMLNDANESWQQTHDAITMLKEMEKSYFEEQSLSTPSDQSNTAGPSAQLPNVGPSNPSLQMVEDRKEQQFPPGFGPNLLSNVQIGAHQPQTPRQGGMQDSFAPPHLSPSPGVQIANFSNKILRNNFRPPQNPQVSSVPPYHYNFGDRQRPGSYQPSPLSAAAEFNKKSPLAPNVGQQHPGQQQFPMASPTHPYPPSLQSSGIQQAFQSLTSQMQGIISPQHFPGQAPVQVFPNGPMIMPNPQRYIGVKRAREKMEAPRKQTPESSAGPPKQPKKHGEVDEEGGVKKE